MTRDPLVSAVNVAFAFAVCALVWGSTWFAIRVSIAPGGFPTFTSAALRFTLAAAIVVPIYLAGRARPGPRGRSTWMWLVASGVLNAAGYAMVYKGEETVSGGLAAVVFCTEPLMIALLVTLTRLERVTRAELVGAMVSLCGITAIFWDRLSVSADQAVGVVLIVAAVTVTSVYALIVKHRAGGIHPLASAAVFLTVTAVTLWAAVVVRGWEPVAWPPAVRPTVALVYLSVFGSVVAFATFFYLLQHTTLMLSSMLVFTFPVIALIVDALWERDADLSGRTYAGIAVTMLGVLIGALRRPRPMPGEPAAPPPGVIITADDREQAGERSHTT